MMETIIPVYYTKRFHKFFGLLAQTDDGFICSGFCDYYCDAQTNIQRQLLSDSFLSTCIEVKAIDSFPFAEISKYGSWKAKGA